MSSGWRDNSRGSVALLRQLVQNDSHLRFVGFGSEHGRCVSLLREGICKFRCAVKNFYPAADFIAVLAHACKEQIQSLWTSLSFERRQHVTQNVSGHLLRYLFAAKFLTKLLILRPAYIVNSFMLLAY